jgi:serine/threonine protein kinase/class 3 adenylate cyclase/Flp pilus assembly protein TadD
MSAADSTSRLMVLMFTDLVDSSALTRQLGDRDYLEHVLDPHNAIFRQLLAQFPDAKEVKHTGDGFMATFASASDAANCALQFHHALRTARWQRAQPQTRIGIHLGELTEFIATDPSRTNVAGHAANMAARVMSLALPEQTLLTRAAFDSARQSGRVHAPGAGPAPDLSWPNHGPYRLKGAEDDPYEVCEVGVVGSAPLQPPPDSEKAKRLVHDEDAAQWGWRPSPNAPILGRPDWVLTELLGEGGFGEVWLARKKHMKEPRVFKFCFDLERLRSFKRELAFSQLLRERLGERDDIARLYDVQVDRPPFFLEGEYVAGGNLAQWAERQGGLAKLPLDTRLSLMVGVARAVAAAHSVGVIHKDLKPSNVLIVESRMDTLVHPFAGDATVPKETVQKDMGKSAHPTKPRPRLCDFGIGVLADPGVLEQLKIDATRGTRSVFVGNDSSRTETRLYAPPESLVGEMATTAGDIYALGVMLYQLVTGDPRRALGTGWEEDIGDELLREVILACTHRDPGRRLPSAADLAERLESLEDRRTKRQAQARAESERIEALRLATERARRVRIHKVISFAATSAAVVVGALAFFSYTQWDRAEHNRAQAQRLQGVAEGNEELAKRHQREAEQNAAVAREQSQLALKSLQSIIFDIARKLEDVPGAGELRRSLLQTAIARLQEVSDQFASRAAIDRNTSVALHDLGDVFLRVGAATTARSDAGRGVGGEGSVPPAGEGPLAAARRLYERAFQIDQQLAAEDPTDVQAQRDLSVSYERLGDVSLQAGQVAEALGHYQKLLEISQKLAVADPTDAQAQRDLSVAYERLGDVSLQAGHVAKAVQHHQKLLAISQKLAAADPTDAQAQRDLSVSYIRLGDVSLQARQVAEALGHYQKGLETCQKLVAADPTNAQAQSDLSISYQKLGDVSRQSGQVADALEHYQKNLEISQKLAAANPTDAQAQRDLSTSLERVGMAHAQRGNIAEARDYFDRMLVIKRQLAERDPADALAQRELGVTYLHLGDVSLQAGQVAEALGHYQKMFEISQKLAAADPTNAQAQHGLSISYERLGRASEKMSDLEAADRFFGKAFQIAQTLIENGSTDVETQILLMYNAALSGKRQRAEQVGRGLVQQSAENPGVLFDVARCYSISARVLTRGKDLLSADEQAMRDESIERAVEMVNRAVAAGWKNQDAIRSEPDLESIREHPAYKEIVEKLKSER